MKYFKWSFIVTVIGLTLAYMWGERVNPGSGFIALFIAVVLVILEVSLSFDNAVVNAVRLRTMTPLWQRRFLTWGILIAVFGMRLAFPVAIVSIFSGVGLIDVTVMALSNPEKYAYYLHKSHSTIASFGGMFLFMLFLAFIFNEAKKVHWIKIIEQRLAQIGKLESIEVIIALAVLYITQNFVSPSDKLPVVLAGISGLVLYLLIDGLSKWLEGAVDSSTGKQISNGVKQAGFISFIYLELIDASFSFDGVLGAFAISKDIIIIAIGLSIGAMFVRSLTVMLVEKQTLDKYIYLEHGAHWAIGALGLIMMYTTFGHVSEVITGLIGVGFIGAAYFSSISKKGPALPDELTEELI
ncbi:MAG: hypothetical protein ACD_20C00128G0007 [uncultured bacterium]|nr:MAG: hypothetical protein ACD_20C00128G0007 [uncultured bacterium]HBH19012.1 hypothetical protein [Cyanobacteria bacterium UBA9579]